MVRANEDEAGRSAVAADLVFLGPPAVGGWLARPLLDNGRGAPRSASSARETSGHRLRMRWAMAVGIVVIGMTASLTVAAAAAAVVVVVTLPLVAVVVVVVAPCSDDAAPLPSFSSLAGDAVVGDGIGSYNVFFNFLLFDPFPSYLFPFYFKKKNF